MGTLYTLILIETLTRYALTFGNQTEVWEKMLMTGSCALLSSFLVCLLNEFVVKREVKYVGIACLVSAFYYFIWHKSGGVDVVEFIFLIVITPYSLFAISCFLFMPLLVGITLNKSRQQDAQKRASA